MISVDTNVLLTAIEPSSAGHQAARAFLASLQGRDDVAISELVLVELYGLLRNPAIVARPAAASAAAGVCQTFRRHPRWRLLGFPRDSVRLHRELWERVAQPRFPRRRIYDLRLALSLRHQAVTELATVNVKDFAGLGFDRVWNPLEET